MAVPGALGGDGEEALVPSTPAASGTNFKVAARPAVVGPCWSELFHPGAPPAPSAHARVRVVADVVGALTQIHGNSGLPREHRRHGRVTPRHVLIGVEGSASLFDVKQPFAKLLPAQPDLGYLAPELLTQSGPPDQRSDVFSVGVMLWEALDNGRLFPHHRAAAISRLIARRALPPPRALEEWAVPLGEVASKALSPNPNERHQSATELWLALREHLPAPDEARAELARLAQQALNLSLTAQIRAQPPYLSSPISGADSSGAPSQAPVSLGALIDADTRYSLPVSSRAPRPQAAQRPTPVSALPPLDWSSLMPPSSRSAPPVPRSTERRSAVPRRTAPPGERPSAVPADAPSFPSPARTSAAPSEAAATELEYVGLTSGQPSPVEEAYSADDELTQRYEARYRFHPEPASAQGGARITEAPIPLIALAPRHPVAERRTAPPHAALLEAPAPRSPLPLPLPPESGGAPPRSSPWLAVTLAAVAFVGVGLGAVVFGAGTAFAPLLGLERSPTAAAAPDGATAGAASPKAQAPRLGARAAADAPSDDPGRAAASAPEKSQPSAKGQRSDSGPAAGKSAEPSAEAPVKGTPQSAAPKSPAPAAKKAKRRKPALAAAPPRTEAKAASEATQVAEASASDDGKAAAGDATDPVAKAPDTAVGSDAPAAEDSAAEPSEDGAPTSLPFVEEPWSNP